MANTSRDFCLLHYMIDIGDAFWDAHPHLQPMCMYESIMSDNYTTTKEYAFQLKFARLYERVQERHWRLGRETS
tara:strand:+ start:375 stop:596 length:222 start_codon:yes stop_codon:yes gene_type:complete